MTSITLRYAAGSQSRTFPVFYVRGLDDVDDIENVYTDQAGPDGQRFQRVTRFRRIITVRFQPGTKTDRAWLLPFIRATDRQLVTAVESVGVTLKDSKRVLGEWIHSELSRAFSLVFDEQEALDHLNLSWATSGWLTWGDTSLAPLGDIGYTFASLT